MASLLLHVVFVFAVLGTKLMLALWVIYHLFPGGKSCPECDRETIPLQMNFAERAFGALLFLGKVRRRWCPECAWDGLARASSSSRVASPPSIPVRTPVDRPT